MFALVLVAFHPLTTFLTSSLLFSLAKPFEPDAGTEYHRRLGGAFDLTGPLVNIFINIAITCIMYGIVAYFYKEKVTDRRPPFRVQPSHSMANGADFRYGICGCFEEGQTCLHGFCCGCLRAADTFSTAGVMHFWTFFFMYVVSYEIGYFMGYFILVFLDTTGLHEAWRSNGMYENVVNQAQLVGYYIVEAIFAIWAGSKRGELRRRFDGQPKTVQDCLFWWCCAPCATCQEAMQVDESSGARAECCFHLVMTGGSMPGPAVGQVVVGQVVVGSVVQVQQPVRVNNNFVKS